MYFALFRCMRIDQDRVGETTSMYANRPRPCMRNDLDVCESTCMRNDLYAKRLASVHTVPCQYERHVVKSRKYCYSETKYMSKLIKLN